MALIVVVLGSIGVAGTLALSDWFGPPWHRPIRAVGLIVIVWLAVAIIRPQMHRAAHSRHDSPAR